MLNLKEVKQKVDGFNKNAMMVLTTALRAPLMLMMGCGYVNFGGKQHNLHDHDDHGGKMMVDVGVFSTEAYNEAKHGKIIDLVEVGDRVTGVGNSTDGKTPIHRHNGKSSTGSQEYTYE